MMHPSRIVQLLAGIFRCISVVTLTAVIIVNLQTTLSHAANSPSNTSTARAIRVGVYEAKPLAYYDKDGSAHGLFVDTLNRIAEKEQWSVQYVPGSWQEGLDRLKSDAIDLVLCIGYTKERDEYMDFPSEYLLLNWGVVYRPKGSQLSSLLELEGKTVSALKGDVYLTGFKELLRQFNVNVKINEVDQYSKVFEAVKSGSVAAGIAGNLYGILNENGRLAEQTPIIFSPIRVGYAVNEGKNGDLIAALDRHLAEMKADNTSAFHRDLENLLGKKGHNTPKEVYWILSGVVATLLFAISFILLLKKQVRAKTKTILEAADQYRAILRSSSDGFWSIDNNGKLLEVNDRYLQISGYSREELIGKSIHQIEAIDSKEDVQQRISELMEAGFLRFESQHRRKDGSVWDVEISTSHVPVKDHLIAFLRDITDIKSAEAEKAEFFIRFKGIMDSLDALVYVADMETYEVLFINEYGRRLFGNIEGQVCWKKLQCDQSGPCAFCTNDRLVSDIGEPKDAYVWEFQNTVTGHWFLCRDKAISWSDNRLVRMEIATDITERKQNEEKIITLSQRLELATSSAKLGIWDWHVAENTMVWNDRMFELYGVNPDNFSNNVDTWLNGLHPEDKEAALAESQAALNGEKEYDTSFRVVHPDGTVKYLQANALVIRDEDGKPVRMTGTNADISGIILAENFLREANEKFSKSFDNAPMMMSISNIQDGTYLDVNQQFLEISGFSRDEVIGKTSIETGWVDSANRELMKARLLQDGSVEDLELSLTTKSGQPLICKYWGEIISIAGQDRLLSIALDITEHRMLEQQLHHTQKLESLGVLAGGIAHDFNNILAIIMGYCQLTKMDYEDAEKHIPEIEKAAERAAALCRQMLAYAGKSSLTKSKINISVLVDEMMTMLKATSKKNVTIKHELGTGLPALTGDDSQIRQVVLNLLINAAEAIGETEGEVQVSLSKMEITSEPSRKDHVGKTIPAGHYICLEVTDNGCGMDETTRKRIFEPFFTTKFTGRGLGMSAVLGIVNAHNGALQLESMAGAGTTFRVYLPFESINTETEEAQQNAVPAFWQGSGTILLAEDEDQVSFIAKTLIKKLGFNVIVAANGKGALELYQKHTADITVVITDMGMPVMSGYDLFYKLKQLNPKLPIIISSGFGEGDISSKIPAGEIAGLINKPYNFDQLRDVLKRVVEEMPETTF